MPEKPKRRKNNKNKRKNKQSRSDNNKLSSEVNELVVTDGSSVENLVNDNSSCDLKPDSQNNEYSSDLIAPDCSNSETLLNNDGIDSQMSNQDHNNNSDDVQSLREIDTEGICNIEDEESNNSQTYVVESPEQSKKHKSKKTKLENTAKSKSLDNDDAPKIVEITESSNTQSEDDNTLAIVDCNNVLVSDVESDIEWEHIEEEKSMTLTDDLAIGTLSIATAPLNVARCDQTKTLTPEAEESLRLYLQTLNLSTNPADASTSEIKTEIEHLINREIRYRLRKKGLADDFLCFKPGPPRILDVIDEEGSSESSATSRRHSHLSDKKSDNEDLEDDVFEDKNKLNDKYSSKQVRTLTHKNVGRQIPQACVLVGAKIKEPEITEARGDWTVKTVEKMTGAEVVYLTDTSSSTSSIHEFSETDDGEETDVSIRMITPTIEVTDTEDFLKKTYSSSSPNFTKDIDEKNMNSQDQTQSINTATNDQNYNDDNVSGNIHEIVILSTENIKTDLYVKDIEEYDKSESSQSNQMIIKERPDSDEKVNTQIINKFNSSKDENKYDLEMKVLKCELNNAMNNLIQEVSSDSENTNENAKDSFTRQDSSSSICSSQCTAKYNPSYSSLNDISNMHDEPSESNKTQKERPQDNDVTSHVKDVIASVTGTTTRDEKIVRQPLGLRDLCVRRISRLPYGEKILEELASVSEKLQNITISSSKSKVDNKEISAIRSIEEGNDKSTKMPYFPLPDLSSIEKIALQTRPNDIPPPVQPRNSSLKKPQEDHWTGLPTKNEPVYICLSPSQKMLMEKTNTVITKEDASELVDLHKKFVDRRGYDEYHQKEKKKEVGNSDPVVPFKSQTGSRLLALIRDPAVTNNMNSSMSKAYNKSLDQLEKTFTITERISKKVNQPFNSISDFSRSFKPIPPPRPRKYSSSFYESDESSDFTDNSLRSMKSERKYFHFSTGNLSKEIENDVSSIQNMHRYYTSARDKLNEQNCPRRPSLPKDLCEQQMEYIRQKEKEVEAEIRRLEEKKTAQTRGPRAPLIMDKEQVEEKFIDNNNYSSTRKKDYICTNVPLKTEKGERSKLSSLFSSSQEELLREKMYSEYVSQMAERQERKQHKIIKITNYPVSTDNKTFSKSMSSLDFLDSKVNNRIEKEFISKARERWDKLGIKDPETEDERETKTDIYKEPKVIEHKIKVIEGGQEKDVQKLPSHLQEFVHFTAKDKGREACRAKPEGTPARERSAGGAGESAAGASPHVVILCAVIILVLAVGKYFLRLLRNR